MNTPIRTKEDTVRFLDEVGLPLGFEWNGQRVAPLYKIRSGFGTWLRTAYYHQALRGLFDEIHETLAAKWPEIETAEDLALELERRRQLRPKEFLPGFDTLS